MNNQVSANSVANNVIVRRDPKPLALLRFGFNNDEHKVLSTSEAIEMASANYQVEKYPLIRISPTQLELLKAGETLTDLSVKNLIGSHFANVRTDNDTTLGIVGESYGVVQNSKAFEFIDFIKESTGVQPIIETAGIIGQGERMFISAAIGEDMELSPNDRVKSYVVFTNTHNGKGALQVFFTPIRVVCQNTLNMAIKGATNKLIFKHTRHVNTRLDWEIELNRQRAVALFSAQKTFSEKFLQQMQDFKGQKVNEQYVRDFAANLYLSDKDYKEYIKAGHKIESLEGLATQTKNRIERLRQSIDFGVGQDLYRGSKLWLINGLTTMLHNDKEYKSAEDEFIKLNETTGLSEVEKAYAFLTAAA